MATACQILVSTGDLIASILTHASENSCIALGFLFNDSHSFPLANRAAARARIC
jgi:hypothetical protein